MTIKSHWQKHKTTYLACGVTAVVVGGVTYIIMKNGKCIDIVGDPEIALPVSQAASIVGAHNTINQTIVNFIERSTPSKRVGLLAEDGTSITQAFNSISDAAKQLGVDRVAISRNVNGLTETAHGLKFMELTPAA